MKIRLGYVSNSSSASFVVYNWFDLSADKRYYIMNYDVNALAIWQKKKIKYEICDEDFVGNSKDYPFYGKEYEYFGDGAKEKFSFGFLNNRCRWQFVENKERNTCTIRTSMDNFNMEKWLKYNKCDFDELAGW